MPFESGETTQSVAIKVLIELHHQILIHEAGAIRGEIEAIHDMRVAIRRVRSALANFALCINPVIRQRARAELENLAAALGEVRDLDVMIESLQAVMIKRPVEDRVHIEALIKRLKRRRKAHHQKLLGYLAGADFAELRMESFT